MKRIRITLPDELYEAAVARAHDEDRDTNSNAGVSSLVRHALRYYLSKNGYSVKSLDSLKTGRQAIPTEDMAGRSPRATASQCFRSRYTERKQS